MCCRWAEQRGREQKEEGDRQMEKEGENAGVAQGIWEKRERVWLLCGKGGHTGRKWSENGTKWQKMATQGWHEDEYGDMWGKNKRKKNTGRHDVTAEEYRWWRKRARGEEKVQGICGFLLITLKRGRPRKTQFLYSRSIKMGTISTAVCLPNRVFAFT